MKVLQQLAALGACASVAFAAVVTPAASMDKIFDVIIIGGGPAGLSAASGLGRVRRNVLLIDSGEYRNDPTRHAHDILGFDGVTPAWLRYAGRKLVSFYKTVELTNGTVTKIDPAQKNEPFTVHTDGLKGIKGTSTVQGRKIILATGMQDYLPTTPGLLDAWGKGIYWCPWCDGYEHKDQRLGILCNLANAAEHVQKMSTLNKDIIVYVNGTDTEANRKNAEAKFPKWEQYLKLMSVQIENRTIKSFERLADGNDPTADPSLPSYPENDKFRINFMTGRFRVRNAFLAEFPTGQKSSVGEDVGVTMYGNKLAVGRGMATNVFGIYAVGDANSDNITNVPHALNSGKSAAVFAHVQLGRESTEALLRKLDMRDDNNVDDAEEVQDVWKRMNEPRDMFSVDEFEGK